MAEVAVDERRLLKTMRWYDGFVIGLANPGFLLVGLGFSVGALGAKVAAILWFVSALIGALQAYVYAEPAAMFPDKPGGLRCTPARAGASTSRWPGRSPCSATGSPGRACSPCTAGSSASCWSAEFFDADSAFATMGPDEIPVLGWDITGLPAHRPGLHPGLLLLQHPRHAAGGLVQLRHRRVMLLPVARDRRRAFITGYIQRPSRSRRTTSSTSTGFFGDGSRAFNEFGLIMVWLYIIGWSTLRPRGAGDLCAGVHRHQERHPKGDCLDRGAECVPRRPAADRGGRHGRLHA